MFSLEERKKIISICKILSSYFNNPLVHSIYIEDIAIPKEKLIQDLEWLKNKIEEKEN